MMPAPKRIWAILALFFSLCVNAEAATFPLRILTYNVWGLPAPTEHAPWRYAEIAKRVSGYDIVAFQETWSGKTDVLWKNLKTHPYHAFGGNPHGLIGGSGLIVISKYPIIESHFVPYQDCSEFECTAKKGVLMFRVRVRSGVEIDFYTTHLNAWLEHDLVRTSQILQMVGQVYEWSEGRPIVIMGDFNSEFRSTNYDEIVGNLSLDDSYEQYVRHLPNPTQAQLNGYSYDVDKNPWAAPAISHEDHPQRLDYIFSRGAGSVRFQVKDSALAFTEPVQSGAPLSDHYAVTTLFSISAE